MRVSFSDGYTMPLPDGHRFPMGKYGALHRILLAEGLLCPADMMTPTELDWADARRVHTPEYLSDLAHGTLAAPALRRLGFGWSAALVRRARLAAAGTLLAAEAALDDGIAANLAGGTHHAFADRGEGFCVLNDVAIAIRVLAARRRLRRALVVDLDVHQGNGTAAIFAGDAAVFTLSLHGARNYPFHKMRSSRDVPLADRTGDEAYLAALAVHLPAAIEAARPDLVFYLAGVDVVAGDRFGRLALTRAGLRRRERFVLETVRARGVPLALLLSGGYARTAVETADLHAVVHRAARGMSARSD